MTNSQFTLIESVKSIGVMSNGENTTLLFTEVNNSPKMLVNKIQFSDCRYLVTRINNRVTITDALHGVCIFDYDLGKIAPHWALDMENLDSAFDFTYNDENTKFVEWILNKFIGVKNDIVPVIFTVLCRYGIEKSTSDFPLLANSNYVLYNMYEGGFVGQNFIRRVNYPLPLREVQDNEKFIDYLPKFANNYYNSEVVKLRDWVLHEWLVDDITNCDIALSFFADTMEYWEFEIDYPQ